MASIVPPISTASASAGQPQRLWVRLHGCVDWLLAGPLPQPDDIQNELDMMSAGSDVESELSRLKGEITAGAPKQLEGGANGNSQEAQGAQAPQGQAQPASIPAADRPAEPQDGEG